MVDLHSRVLSKASLPFSLRTSSDIDFCTKNLHFLQSNVSFIHIALLRLKIFISFTRLAVILFMQKYIRVGRISALLCRCVQRHDARGNPTVDYPPIQGVAAVILQSTSCHRNRRLKLRPGGTPCLVCAFLF